MKRISRNDPVLVVLASKLSANRSDDAPLGGKSKLDGLELSRVKPTRYHKISHDPPAIEALFVDLVLDANTEPPKQIDEGAAYPAIAADRRHRRNANRTGGLR